MSLSRTQPLRRELLEVGPLTVRGDTSSGFDDEVQADDRCVCFVLFLTPMSAGLELVSDESPAPRGGQPRPNTCLPRFVPLSSTTCGPFRPSDLGGDRLPWSPPPGFLRSPPPASKSSDRRNSLRSAVAATVPIVSSSTACRWRPSRKERNELLGSGAWSGAATLATAAQQNAGHRVALVEQFVQCRGQVGRRHRELAGPDLPFGSP